MEAVIAKDEALHMGHFYKSQRHTIQVDFGIFVHDLMTEIGRGERRSLNARTNHLQTG